MRPYGRWVAIILAMLLLMSGCGNLAASTAESESTDSTSTTDATTMDSSADSTEDAGTEDTTVTTLSASEQFTDRDYTVEYDESASAIITLEDTSAQCASNAVEIDGTTVTITDEGTYILSGTLSDGMIVVNAEKTDKVQLVLNGVSINSATSAAIYVLQADKVFITTAADTDNTLSNGGEFVAIDENNIDAVIFSKEDLTLNGQGSLVIESPVGHGVVSKDDLVVTSGSYTITSASQGLSGKDSVRIAGGTFDITAGKDGIHSENEDDDTLGYVYILAGTFQITAEGDGISASNVMQIEDGTFDILAGGGSVNGTQASSENYGQFMGGRGGSKGQMPQTTDVDTTADTTSEDETEETSMKGIKAAGDLVINGGTFTIDSADDAVHSNASISVNGGTFAIATGDDGFHADESLTVCDGTIDITESYEGLEGLNVEISGGDITVVSTDDGINAAGGTDSSGMGGRDTQFAGKSGGFSSSNGSILISGGTIYVQASGDGIDSNGSLEMTGGYCVVSCPSQGDTSALDYDSTATISGGTFIGTGASGMAQSFGSSEQGVISVSVGTQSAGTSIVLQDADGNTILSYEPELDFAVVILSSEEIVTGESYTLTVGSDSGVFEAK